MKNKALKRNGTIGILATSLMFILSVCNSPSGGQSSLEHGSMSDEFDPDLDVEIVAREGQASIFAGADTEVYSYYANMISGEGEALQNIEGSYLGPIIRVRQGQQVRIGLQYHSLARHAPVAGHGRAASVCHWSR